MSSQGTSGKLSQADVSADHADGRLPLPLQCCNETIGLTQAMALRQAKEKQMAKKAIVTLVFPLMVLLFSACTTQRLANDSLQQRASVNTYRAVTFNDGNITVTELGSDEIKSISQCGSRAVAILRKATSDDAELVLLSLETRQIQAVVRSDFAQPRGCSPDGRYLIFDSPCDTLGNCPPSEDPDEDIFHSVIYDSKQSRAYNYKYYIHNSIWSKKDHVAVRDSSCGTDSQRRADIKLDQLSITVNCEIPTPINYAYRNSAIVLPKIIASAGIEALETDRGSIIVLLTVIAQIIPGSIVLSCSPNMCVTSGGIYAY